MIIARRRDSKVRKVGTSLVTTIPAEYVHNLNLKPNDQLVVYQIREALLVVPLAWVLKIGEPTLVKMLEALAETSSSASN